MSTYQEQIPSVRVLGADTIRIELAERQYGGHSYRFLALKDGKILDIAEFATDEWSLREATLYIRYDRWISIADAEIDLTEAAGYHE